MTKKNIEAIYPLSPMQQGILFHTLYAPQSGMYFEQTVYTLHGDLDVSAFERAWQRVVERHTILRTLFLWKHRDEPLQVVRERGRLPWDSQDWRGLSPVEQQKRLEGFLKADRARGFELSQAPLMRLALIQVAEDTYQFLWSFHHLVLDRWSLSLVLKEVFAFYTAFHRGQDLHLEPGRPYRDYIAWFKQQDLAQAEAFWRQALKGFTAPTALGVDRAPGSLPGQETLYDEQQVRLSAAATVALQALTRQHRLTLNTLVQGAWALLLSRYSGEEEVVFGAVVSGRPVELAGVESMVGLFINTLPLRIRVSAGDSLLSWLRRLQEQMVELQQYEYTPLVQVQGWSEVPRGLPLFESLLVFQNIPVKVSLRELGGSLEVSALRSEGNRTNYPLTMVAVPGPELLLWIIYDGRRFDAPTITRMVRQFQTLLEGIVADPEQRLEAERHQVLVEWNATQTDYPRDRCIHELFDLQVERTPEAVAVVFEGREVSYRELDYRANQLAHYLRGLGVRSGVLVGVCLERSAEMVVGVLGVLKAGGAYVPLDPEYPRERLGFMLEDAQAPVLLTQGGLVDRLPEYGGRAVCLDTSWSEISAWSAEQPVSSTSPEDLAYVIYTSGSTGRPKGVEVVHRAVVNLLTSLCREPGLGPEDVLVGVTTLSFDTAVVDLFWPLSVGARVVIASRAMAMDGVGLSKRLVGCGATVMQATPASWRLLVEAGWRGGKGFKVLCTGEALPRDLADALLDRAGRVWNLYGPTETTVWATGYELKNRGGPVWIGRPIGNVRVYALDRYLQPVPVGVAGELYIGGAGVSRGYLNRPELTAERFIPNPFSPEPGARLYKTGDLARYRPDGTIEFLGRLDQQVKIRGFRVELGEVEAVLGQHPAMRESVVVAREDLPGDKRLVAYIVPRQAPAPGVRELRGFLAQKLPGYMVPAAFVPLKALPLTPNGKVDRRALPAPDSAGPDLEQVFVAPRTPIEGVLARIWSERLGLEQVGIHDNFFELGGHSLLAMQLVSKMSVATNRDISVRCLFSHPSIASLAEELEELPSERVSQAAKESVVGAASTMPSEGGYSKPHLSPFMKLERRPLLSLFAAGKVAPVDAAALDYLTSEFITRTGLTRDQVIHGWCDDLPIWHSIRETFLGRIATIRLPRFDSELYHDQEDLVEVILQALEMAGRIGARTVSLTGLIPSATDYGHAVITAMSGRRDLPLISTGHATTAAAMVLAIKRILQESGRDLAQEHVGFLGLGSIGLASLRLMLTCLPRPAKITLCDVYKKREALEKIEQELISDLRFRGALQALESQGGLPPDIYDATLIVGTTNVPSILDIECVKPGTLVVADPGPHCFSVKEAARRFQTPEDILFTEGDVLQSPHPIHQVIYLPRSLEQKVNPAYIEALASYTPFQITSCVLSSLLSDCFENLKPTVGLIEEKSSLQHYERLVQLGFQAAGLRCADYVLLAKSIRNFRRRFGKPSTD